MSDVTLWKARIARGEGRNIDFKDPMPWDKRTRDKLGEAIVALANTRDGGMILIGVTEKTPDKAPSVLGVTDEQAQTYDPSPIGTYLAQHFQPAHSVRTERIAIEGKTVIAIFVDEFAVAPIVCVKQSGTYRDAPANTKPWFKPGDLLLRTAAAESRPVQSGDEMRELLRLALTKTKETLLADMRRIIEGAPAVPVLAETPGAVAAKEWAKAAVGFRELLGKENMPGTFEFECVFPTPIAAGDEYHERLQQVLSQARVDPKSWGDIPYDPQYDAIRNQAGFVSVERTDVSKWSGYQRVARLYRDGFVGYAEDRIEARPGWANERLNDLDGRRTLLWARTASRTAAALLFLGRLCEAVGAEQSVELVFRWTSLKDTVLYLDNGYWRELRYMCVDDVVTYRTDISAIDVRTAPGITLRAALNHLLTMYQVEARDRTRMAEEQARALLPSTAG